jgi:co-chaperonin GroES (HSP10)
MKDNMNDKELLHHLAMQKLKQNPMVNSHESKVPLGTAANTTNAMADKMVLGSKQSEVSKTITRDFIKLSDFVPATPELMVTVNKVVRTYGMESRDNIKYWSYPNYKFIATFVLDGEKNVVGVKEYRDSVVTVNFKELNSNMFAATSVTGHDKEGEDLTHIFRRIPVMTHDKVALAIVSENQEQFQQTDSGLYLSDKKTKYGKFGERFLEEEIKYQTAIIVSKGPGEISHHTMQYLPTQYDIGDEVLIGYWGGTIIDFDHEEYKVCREYDIICKLPAGYNNVF